MLAKLEISPPSSIEAVAVFRINSKGGCAVGNYLSPLRLLLVAAGADPKGARTLRIQANRGGGIGDCFVDLVPTETHVRAVLVAHRIRGIDTDGLVVVAECSL